MRQHTRSNPKKWQPAVRGWLVLFALAGVFSAASAQAAQSSSIAQILNNRALWGKDFPAALAYLTVWGRIGEPAVGLFSDRAVGTTPYKTRETAQQAADKLARALKEPQPQPAPELENLLKDILRRPAPFEAAAIPFLDDDSFRAAWTGRSLQFLAESLKMERVKELLGKPEKTTTQLVQNETERRPVVLTLHSYAEGAIVFVESDFTPRPGFVDRVILDVAAVTAVVFKEAL